MLDARGGKLMCLLSLMISLPVLAQQELLKNPSFEELDEKGFPAGWRQYGGGVPESQLSVVPTAHSGQRAIRLLDTGPNVRDGRYAIGVQQEAPVVPGRFYLASVWAKAQARNHEQAVLLQITFLGGTQERSFNTYITAPIGGNWKRYSVGAVAPPDAKTARLYIYTMHFWTSDTLIDDASFKEISSVSSLAQAVYVWGQEPLAGPRPLKLHTPIVQNGQPAAFIASPADPQWRRCAEELQTALQRKTGVRLPIELVSVQTEFVKTMPGAPPQIRDNRAKLSELLKTNQTIIALGNLNNNFIIERLYWNGYTRADALWPGAGAFALRSVHQPFNFNDINILTIEASDVNGAQAGVQECVQRLPAGPQCALEKPLLYVSHMKPQSAEQRQKLLESPPSASLWVDFHRACAAYRDTGDEAWALQAKRIMGLCRDRLVADPSYKLDWPEETSSNEIGKMWDVIEEAPVWTESERAEAENVLFATLLGLRRNVYNWGTFANNDTIVWNHQTFPLMGIYWLGRWFERYYPGQEPISDYMAQVHGAFRGQIKSWKPQCDADSYLTIVPRHTIEYTLAQNDYRYFAEGQVRQFAEYLTGVCDNSGGLPGFGDSGYGKGPGYELNGLPLAFWYYKDPRYLWRLQQLYSGKWNNPYHQDITPQPWPEIVGVNVYRMPPEYYRWATHYSAYSEPLEKTEVPYEKSFDKISFREHLTEDGQFLLLDGFARGKHLHYDGNAIIKYHDRGEDWLIDGDYLVRNTTEHNMISVVRDGRCAQLEPAFVSLEIVADLPTVGFTRTKVANYNGADWTRDILWLKGEAFVVLDTLTAREPGEYTFENVFKMLEEGKLEYDGRCLQVSRPTAGGRGSRDLTVALNPEPNVPKAVCFGSNSSRMEFPVSLPAGEYTVVLWGKGRDSSSDSFFLTIDGGELIAHHVPIDKIGPSSGAWTKDVPAPNVKIARDGIHYFCLTLRESPGTLLQKIVIMDRQGQEIMTIDALNPPPMPQELLQAAPEARFHIKGDGAAPGAITSRVNNVNLRLKYLRHLFGGKLAAGQMKSDQVLIYSERSDQPRELDIRRVEGQRVLILRQGQPYGLLIADAKRRNPQNPDVQFYMANRVIFLNKPDPVSPDSAALEIDLKEGQAATYATAPTTWRLGGRTYSVPAGKGLVQLTADQRQLLAIEATRALAEAARQAQKPQPVKPPQLPYPSLFKLWAIPALREAEGETAQINCLKTADLTGDGQPECLVGRGKQAAAFDLEGQLIWTIETGARVNDLTVADLDGEGLPEVLVASDDEHLYIAEARGQLRTRIHCNLALRIGTSSVRDPRVAHVAVGDVDADGKPDIIIGTRNGHIARYDVEAVRRTWGAAGEGAAASFEVKPLWSFNQIEHGTYRLRLLDLDRDGKLEIVAGNRYGSVEILNHQGQALPGTYSELGDVVFDVGDVNGDGKPEILNGSSTGAFTCTTWGDKTLWNFNNYGYGVKEIIVADVDDDGQSEIAVASETCYVYLLQSDGSIKTMKRLSAPVLSLARLGQQLIAGCRDGMLYVLNAHLEPQQAFSLGSPITHLSIAEYKGEKIILAAASDRIEAFQL